MNFDLITEKERRQFKAQVNYALAAELQKRRKQITGKIQKRKVENADS